MLSSTKNQAAVIKKAADEVMTSQHLTKLLHIVLAIGNALNNGSKLGSASGFKIESLLKLSGATCMLSLQTSVIIRREKKAVIVVGRL